MRTRSALGSMQTRFDSSFVMVATGKAQQRVIIGPKNPRTRILECLMKRRSNRCGDPVPIRATSNPCENVAARRVEKRNTGPAMVSMVTHTVDFPGKRLIQYSFGRQAATYIYTYTYTHIHTYIHIYIKIYIYEYICKHIMCAVQTTWTMIRTTSSARIYIS